MDRRYHDDSFHSDRGEPVPLDNPSHYPSRNQYPPSRQQHQQQQQQSSSHPNYNQYSYNQYSNNHSNSYSNNLREAHRRSRGYEAAAGAGAGALAGGAYGAAAEYSRTTPGADDFGEGASGGLAGIATSIAERNARESGLEAMRAAPQYDNQGYGQPYDQDQGQGQVAQYGYDHIAAEPSPYGHNQSPGHTRPDPFATPYASSQSLAPPRSQHGYANNPFEDPHALYAQRIDPRFGPVQVNPNDIIDDGDDGLEYRPARNSMLSLGNASSRSAQGAAGGIAAGAAAGTAAGVAAGGNYAPVGANDYNLANIGAKEQSEWIKKQSTSSKKWKWILIAAIGLVIAGGIVVGILFGVVFKKNNGAAAGGSSSGQSASDDTSKNGDLDINSSEIQALLNNPGLHKVFPGVDYTPLNTQFPDCLKNPPSQNNITRDVAVLSQLTNTIRLYGTDCNQTEMTIHALKQLKMDSHIKIWLGVWQDNNATTNARQLKQMWDILDTYGGGPFEGLIVANEILFREQMTVSELGSLLKEVRSNLTSKGLSLPVATSDLGDKWTSELAGLSDYIMSNIHPFFAGENAKTAAAWTWSFWDNHNQGFFKTEAKKNVISETGWPSQGGTDCGTNQITDCPNASVAGIDEMNTFMEGWVCDALKNGTNYFWFEMFDEPWKIQFNTQNQNWEDHWGLMTVDRKLKDGVKIPDCGGKTV